MVMPTEEITGTTGILDAIARAAASLGIGMWFVRLMAVGIAVSVAGSVVLYVASPVKMLFGSVSRGVFSDKIMKLLAVDAGQVALEKASADGDQNNHHPHHRGAGGKIAANVTGAHQNCADCNTDAGTDPVVCNIAADHGPG